MITCWSFEPIMSKGELCHYGFLEMQEIDKRPVCVKCSKNTRQVIRFLSKRNGEFIPYGYESALSGDLWVCPICNTEIIKGFGDRMEKSVSFQALESNYSILQGVRDDYF